MKSLRVEGEVEAELELDFEDLAGLDGQIPDLTTVVPGREGGAVRFASILGRARPRSAATHATLTSGDGHFSASVPLAALDEAVVAYRDGSGVLPEARGGPYRFFIPGSAACANAEIDRCANVKDLAEIRLGVGAGSDTRPTNPVEHAALHDHED